MNKGSAKDRVAAEEWVMKMLDEPQIHQADLEKWLTGRPDRRALFDDIMRDIESASAAAATMVMHVKPDARSWRWAAVLAAGLVGLSLLSAYKIWLSPARQARELSSGPISTGVVSTPVGEVRTVDLADGSHVTLDTDSILAVSYSGQRRSLQLRRGRARFIVAHDPDRPFIVQAGTGEIMATGTVFDVNLNGIVKVNLIQGSVKVTAMVRSGARSVPGNIELKKGQETSYDGSPRLTLVARPYAASTTEWTQGTRSLDDVPIKDLISEANRYSNKKIELADPTLQDRRLFGELNIRDIDQVANASAAYLDLDVDRRQPDKLILRPKK
jgi:transmembrane sensor